MKSLILVLLLSSLSGCAWVALDRYYGVNGESDQWQSEFRPGKTSTKAMGYPDTQIHSFFGPEFKISVDISYQDIGAFGPLLIPIIPTPWDSSRDLTIEATVYTQSEIEIDFGSWEITTNGVGHIPEEVFVAGMDEAYLGRVKLTKNSTVFLSYKLKAADVDALIVDFGSILKGEELIKIPALKLLKTKGTWHYEVWTV